MGWMSYRRLRSRLSSAFTLTTLAFPSRALASSGRTESRTWQARLQGAQNTINTGSLDCRTSAPKFASLRSVVEAPLWFVFMLSVFVQLHLAQCTAHARWRE